MIEIEEGSAQDEVPKMVDLYKVHAVWKTVSSRHKQAKSIEKKTKRALDKLIYSKAILYTVESIVAFHETKPCFCWSLDGVFNQQFQPICR